MGHAFPVFANQAAKKEETTGVSLKIRLPGGQIMVVHTKSRKGHYQRSLNLNKT
jgi:hypothetical protein